MALVRAAGGSGVAMATKAPPAKAQPQTWQNRIVGEGEEAPDQLLANPLNYRVHPKAQQDALAAVLNEVGWVQRVIVNQRTGHVVDGHARIGLAISRREPSVPVLYVDLAPEEEAKVLATLDPISAMAGADKAILEELLGQVSTGEAALQQMLDDLASRMGVVPSDVTGPEDFPEYGDDLACDYKCPKCSYEWSGKPK